MQVHESGWHRAQAGVAACPTHQYGIAEFWVVRRLLQQIIRTKYYYCKDASDVISTNTLMAKLCETLAQRLWPACSVFQHTLTSSEVSSRSTGLIGLSSRICAKVVKRNKIGALSATFCMTCRCHVRVANLTIVQHWHPRAPEIIYSPRRDTTQENLSPLESSVSHASHLPDH